MADSDRDPRAADPLVLVTLDAEQIVQAKAANGPRTRPTHALVCGPYGQVVGTELQCRKYYEAWKILYVGVLFSEAFESETFPVTDLKWTANLATILIDAAEGTDHASTPTQDPERERTQRDALEPPRAKLVFIHLTPKQRSRAKRVNRSAGRITHAVFCGGYGTLFGTEELCRAEYEAWRKLYVGLLFETTFSSYAWDLSDYKTTPDLTAILAAAAESYSGMRSNQPPPRRRQLSRHPLPPSRSKAKSEPQDAEAIAAAVVKAQEQAKARNSGIGCLLLLIIGGIVWAVCSFGGFDGEDDLPASNARELAEECFSGWSGNHREFERLVSLVLNDPNSMEVHGTYFNANDSLSDGIIRIRMDYSAANIYGGMVRSSATADMELDCTVEIISYG